MNDEIRCNIEVDDEPQNSLVGMYFVEYFGCSGEEDVIRNAGQIIAREEGFYLYRSYYIYGDDGDDGDGQVCGIGKTADIPSTDGYGNVFVLTADSIINDAMCNTDEDSRRYIFFDKRHSFVEFCSYMARQEAEYARRKKNEASA